MSKKDFLRKLLSEGRSADDIADLFGITAERMEKYLDGEVFVADSRESKIKIFSEADNVLKESFITDRTLREVVPVYDWQHKSKLLLCRFDDSISIFSRDDFQELFSLKGAFFGILEPRYLFGYPFLEE